MPRRILAGLALAIMPLASTAQVIQPERVTLPVAALGGGLYEVVDRPLAGPAQVWCGAGIYAKRVLGRDRGRLYIAEAYGPAKTVPGGRGVTFSLEDVPEAYTSLGASYRRPGLNKSITMALALCQANPDIYMRIRTKAGTFAR